MPTGSTDRLDSWKEIATYLSRSVRTVRRWEADEGLPVHRHVHRALGSVYAYKSELDNWRQTGRRAESRRLPTSARPTGESRKSIAVLPFANQAADGATDFFADGLADEIRGDLSRLGTLLVTSRTSSMAFKGSKKTVRTIARELGVRFIVEGTVRIGGDQLRLSAQLIDANADEHVWSGRYDGPLQDVFAIQERLARVIVSSLEVQLSDNDDRRLAERQIPDVRAFECYLRARHEAWRWRKDAIDRAVQLLRQGLEIVGENAGLYAALGFAYLQYREAAIDFSKEPLNRGAECSARISALDPASPAGMRLRGWLCYARGEIQHAVRDLRGALDADPNDADAMLLLCNCYLISGKMAAARRLIDRVLAADPLTPLTRCLPGWADALEGRFASAIDPYGKMLDMDPGNPMARLFYILILSLNDRRDAVRDVARAFPSETTATIPARIASFLTRANDEDERGARAALTPEVERAALATDVFPRILAHGFARLGDARRTIDWLEVAVDRGFINYPYLAEHDPSLALVRTDPRFLRLLDDVRRRWQEFEE